MDACVEELFELENLHNYTNIMRKILYEKYVKVDLNKVMKHQCQNRMEYQRKDLLK